MTKKALIFDLDDTIYPIKPFADEMFATLFDLLKSQLSDEVYQQVKEDVLTTPFHRVADRYKFNKELKEEGMKLSLKMTYNGPIKAFEDYQIAKDLAIEKFLVTAGYTDFQKSKIKLLGIKKDFKEIFIPDPAKSDLSKKDVFLQILQKYHFLPGEVLVIGDNPEAEIVDARELGIETYLYDYQGKYSPALANYYGSNYANLPEILN
ncbi:HAD family hydrolase [uncultured Mucilaginibacter sp.]|uniref:HAD family hydrolase n=1 Tax=uncultured Mucilaginibacter sp. TaxID=797541 RepID=UPI0026290467|nr:HAD family hydrolase [uncultured Mucilaginibacter sp.]